MEPAAYRFGRFELRSGYHELRRDGVAIKVEPKPLEVLAELLQNAGELVTKNELMDTVWAGRVVTESVITRCIKKIRDALEDESQSLIVSVHGYGYRFNARVTVVEAAAEDAAPLPNVAVPRVGDMPPLRPHWRLQKTLDERGLVWLAQNGKTGDLRVFKFALSQEQVRALRHEITIQRLLLRGLGEREDIARLLDYNLEAPPYFLELEYCPLGNMSDWCAAEGGLGNMTLEFKVGLLARLCGALASAHSLGVLHMDIKPSNVLVWQDRDARVQLRWTDFGSGRLLQPGRLADLGITRLGSTATVTGIDSPLQGSLNYVAPEILRGEAPTMRSDIYALGVMLYQIAAGDLRKPLTAGWELNVADELLREDITATANDSPSLRLNSADELAVRLSTLEQRRTARSAERRRESESILLRQKLERERARRPWLIATTVALATGLLVSLWGYRVTLRARDDARAQADIADAVIDFLDKDILSLGSPFSVSENGPAHLTVRDAVDRAAGKLDGRFPGQPAVEASIRATLGQVYTALGEDEVAAEQQVRRAVQLGHAAAGGVDERTLRAEFALVYSVVLEQRISDARALLDEANREYDRRQTVSLETRLKRDSMNGAFYFISQDYRAAIPFLENALADQLQRDRTDTSALAIRQMYLARCYAAVRRFEEAERLYAQALGEVRQAEKHPGTLTGIIEEQYGIGLFFAARDEDAKAMLRAAHADLKAANGDDGLTTEALTYLGWVQLRDGQTVQAKNTLREANSAELGHPEDATHWTTLRTRACLGLAELATREEAQGLADLGTTVNTYERELGPNAAEVQLFKFLLLENSLALHRAPSDIGAQLARLNAARMAQAAPWEDWSTKLVQLQAKLVAAAPVHPVPVADRDFAANRP